MKNQQKWGADLNEVIEVLEDMERRYGKMKTIIYLITFIFVFVLGMGFFLLWFAGLPGSEIQRRGFVPYEDVVKLAEREGRKISNAERRLRHSESPFVKAVMGRTKQGKEFIKGYEWNAPRNEEIYRPVKKEAPRLL